MLEDLRILETIFTDWFSIFSISVEEPIEINLVS
jgi:hypothetical protein